jgi:hypothetical protein
MLDPLGLYTLSTTENVNPLPPSAEIDRLLRCLEKKLKVELTVVSTSEITPYHAKTDGHMHGTSVDVSDRHLKLKEQDVQCAANSCGSVWTEHDKKHHYHMQLKDKHFYGG